MSDHIDFDGIEARKKLAKFLDKGLYLPKFMRKNEDRRLIISRVKRMLDSDPELYNLDVSEIHKLIVNKFLWFMAVHGYTLQKTRLKANFYDIDKTIEQFLSSL